MSMDPSWDYYETPDAADPTGAERARVELDLRTIEDAPHDTRPVLLRLRIERREGDHALATALCTALAPLHDARLVARLLDRAHLELVLYVAREEGVEDDVRELVADHPGHRVRVVLASDPGWLHVRETLYPDRIQSQWMQDRRVVEALASSGDRLEVPRPVDHALYFRSHEARQAFTRLVHAEGFECDVATDGDGSLRFGLVARRSDPVVLAHIHRVVRGLIERAEACGGQYDNWGAPVVRSRSKAPPPVAP